MWLRTATIAMLLAVVPSTQSVSNTAMLAGETVVFTCIVDFQSFIFIQWREYSHTITSETINSNEDIIYAGDSSVKARYSVVIKNNFNATHSLSTLTISNVQMGDGGLYECNEVVSANHQRAELIVIENDLNCSWTNAEDAVDDSYLVPGDVIETTCVVTYQGTLSPLVTCSGTENLTSAMTSSGDDTIYTSTGYVGSSANISCMLWFEPPRITDKDNAVNAPEFTSTWDSGTISKHYPASTISISPTSSTYLADDVITCTASGGFPEPVYKWTNIATSGTLGQTQNITITSDLDGVSVRCTAITIVRGESHELSSDIQITVTGPTPDTPWGAWTGRCAVCGGCGRLTRTRVLGGVTQVEDRSCPAKRCTRALWQRTEVRRSGRGRLIRRERKCCYSWFWSLVNPKMLEWTKLCMNVRGVKW